MRYLYTFCLFVLPFCVMCQVNEPIIADNELLTEEIEVKFTFSKECKGEIYVSCFQYEENFMDSEKATFSKVLPCQDSIIIEGINPELPRAILGFIDLNGNKEIDINFFGIPTEPYAVSNGFDAKWREPKFEDAIESSDSKVLKLDFLFWKDR